MQLLKKFNKILYMGFRATLNFRKFKVALNLIYRILLNFAKTLPTCSPMIGQFFETMIVASTDKGW